MKQLFILLGSLLLTTSLYAEKAKAPLKDSETWFKEGLSALEKKQYGEAIDIFEKAELESKTIEKVYYNKGLAHLELKEYDLAEEHLRKALQAQDVNLTIKASYNLGHLHYQKSIVPSTDGGSYTMKKSEIQIAQDYFRDVKNFQKQKDADLNSESEDLIKRAIFNEALISARYKVLNDQKAKEKGSKLSLLSGTVKANGRPIEGATVYIKSKWKNEILGQTKSDSSGAFKIDGLEMGKYQLAAALYNDAKLSDLQWSEAKKVPAYEKDTSDLSISGALSLASPYQASHMSLPLPYDDALRMQGADSITKSTDWGELTDGKSSESFSETQPIDTGYVAFLQDQFQIAMGVPQQQQQVQQQVQQTTEPSAPPTYTFVLKGFNGGDSPAPLSVDVMGMKKEQEKPIKLYHSVIKTTDTGVYEWKSDEFAQQDCRTLIFSFTQSKGKKTIFHEIEVNEDLKQDQQNQDQQQDQDQQQQQQNKDKQDQQKKDEQKQQQKKQQQKPQAVQAILDKVRKKNEDEKREEEGTGVILRTLKDY